VVHCYASSENTERASNSGLSAHVECPSLLLVFNNSALIWFKSDVGDMVALIGNFSWLAQSTLAEMINNVTFAFI